MKRHLASYMLAILFVSTIFQSMVWLSYSINIEQITEQFCVYKAKPEMRCNGKCHINKVLENTGAKQTSSNVPTDVLSKLQLSFVPLTSAPKSFLKEFHYISKRAFKKVKCNLSNGFFSLQNPPPEQKV